MFCKICNILMNISNLQVFYKKMFEDFKICDIIFDSECYKYAVLKDCYICNILYQ